MSNGQKNISDFQHQYLKTFPLLIKPSLINSCNWGQQRGFKYDHICYKKIINNVNSEDINNLSWSNSSCFC